MPIINNPKTQSTVDNVLNTLQIWFGSGGNNTNTTNQIPPQNENPQGQVCPRGERLVSGVCVPYNTGGGVNTGGSKNNTLKYVGIGAGIIVLGLTTYLIIKKRKK